MLGMHALTPNQEGTLQLLQLIRKANMSGGKPRGWFYSGPADLLLREAEWWDEPGGQRINYCYSLPNSCFRNAALYVLEHPKCRYVEGYATSIIPVHHAWVADSHNRVIEVSWSQLGTAYFGIRFRPRQVVNGSVLFNERKLAIYKRQLKRRRSLKGVAC